MNSTLEKEVSTIKQKYKLLSDDFDLVNIQNKIYLDNLHYAGIIQDATLPKQRHFDRIFKDSFFIYKPKSIIGGDFYWCSENEKFSFLAVGDCTGHGVPGAMLATLGTSLLNYAILNKGLTRSAEILKEIDKRFIESFNVEGENSTNNDWMELGLVIYNKHDKTIEFSGARTPLFIARGQNILEFQGNRFPIGGWKLEQYRNYSSQTIPLRNEDFVYMTTDGIIDQFGGNSNKRFTKNKLKYLMLSNYYKQGNIQKEIFNSTINSWKNFNEQTDDICLVGVKLQDQD